MKKLIYGILTSLMLALTLSSCSGMNYIFGAKTHAVGWNEEKYKAEDRLIPTTIEESYVVNHERYVDNGGILPQKVVDHDIIEKNNKFGIVNLSIWGIAFFTIMFYLIGSCPLDAHMGWVHVDGETKFVSYTDFGAGENYRSAPEGWGIGFARFAFMAIIGGVLFYLEYNWILDDILDTRKGIIAVPVGLGILAEIVFLYQLFKDQVTSLIFLTWMYVAFDFCLGTVIMLCNVDL